MILEDGLMETSPKLGPHTPDALGPTTYQSQTIQAIETSLHFAFRLLFLLAFPAAHQRTDQPSCRAVHKKKKKKKTRAIPPANQIEPVPAVLPPREASVHEPGAPAAAGGIAPRPLPLRADAAAGGPRGGGVAVGPGARARAAAGGPRGLGLGVAPGARRGAGVRRAAPGLHRRRLAPRRRGHHAHASLLHHRGPLQAGPRSFPNCFEVLVDCLTEKWALESPVNSV